jgi:hypothetical protein
MAADPPVPLRDLREENGGESKTTGRFGATLHPQEHVRETSRERDLTLADQSALGVIDL